MMMKLVFLAVGGVTGTLARYFLSGSVHGALGTHFPHGTLVVNLFGCLIIGFLAALTEGRFALGPDMRLLLMVGFCGAFTTFSALIGETSGLIRDGETLRALVYVLLSVLVGFIVFRIGFFLGDALS